jgi:hypothetical protein
MSKLYYQQLFENLSEEVSSLKKQINNKKMLLEYFGGGGVMPDDTAYPSVYNPKEPNTGGVAGFGVGAAANPTAIVQNPAVIQQYLGVDDGVMANILGSKTMLKGVGVIHNSGQNAGFGMGLGVKPEIMKNIKQFLSMHGVDSKIVDDASTDDPDGPKFTPWQEMNQAVSNYSLKKAKEALKPWGLYNGDIDHNQYPEALSDKYNVFLADLSRRKRSEIDRVSQQIAGKPVKASKGKSVDARVRQMTGAQMNRFKSIWEK